MHLKPALYLTSLFLGLIVNASAQDCLGSYYPLKEGSFWELSNFNAKGNPTGRTANNITDVTNTTGSFKGTVHTHTYNEKNKELSSGDFTITCANGDILINMESMITKEQQQQFKDMDVKITGTDMIIPKKLAAEQTLADASMKADIFSNNALFASISYIASQRKVLAKESVTVPAGTYECYKITSNIHSVTTTMGIPIKFDFVIIEWYAPNVGLVRSETYNKGGALTGYTTLSKAAY